MNNKTSFPLLLSYTISLALTIALLVIKLNSKEPNEMLMLCGVISTISFIILCVNDVKKDKSISRQEKMMWMLSLIFFSILSGIVYLVKKKFSIRYKV